MAIELERIQRNQRISFKDLVNDALRQGLKQMSGPARRKQRYKTRTVALGRCLIGSLDDVAEVLAVAEGERKL